MSRMALNIAHFKKGAVGSLGGHNWYKRGEHDEHSNQDIDPQRSKDNIALVLPEEGTFYQDVKATVEQSTGRVTAASVWVSEWVLYPPEELQDPRTADREKLRQYYGDALDWMREQGYQVKLAAIHLDETTVHAHIDTVPLTQDGRLSRKEVYTRAALNGIHTDLAAHLAARGWDIQRGESTKEKQVRSVSVPEYKKQAEAAKKAALERVSEAEGKVEALTGELGVLQQQVSVARQNAKNAAQEAEAAEARLQDIQEDLNHLETPEAVKSVEAKPTMMGGAVKLPREDWELVKSWADRGAAAISYGDNMQRQNEQLREEVERLQEAASGKMQLHLQNAELQKQLRDLQTENRRLRAFWERIKQQILAKAWSLWEKFVTPAKAKEPEVLTFEDSLAYWRKHDQYMYHDQLQAAAEIHEYETGMGGGDVLMAELMRKAGDSERNIQRALKKRYPYSELIQKGPTLSFHK